ncbi:VgrG-related protein [Nostoc sp. UHCC 0302]|uniref:VgrG-related protein n=1 Tax=Nostoc sp. UHCC 0302 TaxID=3134896 RepID=UPI00311CA7B9
MSTESLYLSLLRLEIDGEKVTEQLALDVLQVTIEESLHLPAMFTLVIYNRYAPTHNEPEINPWQHDPLFEIGKKVKLGFCSSTTQDPDFKEEIENILIEGEITGMEVNFDNNNRADIIVRGYDFSHRLHRGRYNRAFENQTDSDIVDKIVKEVGITPGNIEASGEAHEYVFQENQTNMELLRERAARIGFELFMSDGKMNFCKPKAEGDLALKWGDQIKQFRVRVTSAEQVNSVTVRAWNYGDKEPIIETATTEKQLTETGNKLGSSTNSAFSNLKSPEMIAVDKPVASAKEAEIMAQALCDELGGEFVYADAQAEGNPDIRPGQVINLENMGDRYSGKYYVTDTRHFMEGRVYKTDFSVRGLRSGNLFTTLSTEKRLRPSQTLLIGIVTDNKDPEELSRVKVKFPTLTEEHNSYWARVVAIGAGKNRGFDCLPEIQDEVLVGFEHGDIHRPFVIGGLWNGKDAPPENVDDSVAEYGVRLRTFKTRVGHILQFIDGEGEFSGEEDEFTEEEGEFSAGKGKSKKPGIRLITKDGHRIYMNDDGEDGSIQLRTKSRNRIYINNDSDLLHDSIAIKTKGGHKITMKDTPSPLPTLEVSSLGKLILEAKAGIEISTLAGAIEISTSFGAINMTASTIVAAEAPTINLTAATIIAAEAPTINLAAATTVAIESPLNVMVPLPVPPPV